MKYIKCSFLALICILIASCSWVKDDLDDCPAGVWLQLEYAYNMLDVDAAQSQISEACIFVYDCDSNYVGQIQVSKTELEQNGYRVELNDLPQGVYHLVVWCGLSDSHYLVNNSQKQGDFMLSLSTEAQQKVADNLGDLFFGCADSVVVDRKYAVHRIPLHKDTNRIACIVELESDNVNTSIYKMELSAANSQLNGCNQVVSKSVTTYSPYFQQDTTIVDEDYGNRPVAEFMFSTLRLLENDNARLSLKLRDTDYTVFDIPVSQYIAQVASLYELNGKRLSAQEYLDRQDLHTFVFCLSPGNDALVRCRVNNWVIRSHDQIKL